MKNKVRNLIVITHLSHNFIMMQQRPFYEIFSSSRYRLRYGHAYDPLNIAKVIKDTSEQFDEIPEADFDQMIKTLTVGGASSVIALRRDPNIITSLCTNFPTKINKKHIDKIIKAMKSPSYPKYCIDAITDIGHVLTKTQLKYLISAGYDMMSGMDTMNYDEFIALFDNNEYTNNLRYALSSNYDESPNLLDEKIREMNNLRVKYDIKFDSKFIDTIMTKVYKGLLLDLNSLINIHIVAKSLDIFFDKNQLKNILSNYTFRDLISYYEEARFDDDHKSMLLKRICNYYPCTESTIDRDFILDFRDKFTIIKLIVHPSLTNYNPLEDLFYMLVEMGQFACEYLNHLLKFKYLNYDDFLLYLLSLGFDNDNATIMHEYISKNNIKIHDDYLPFFYMFTNCNMINILLDNKIMPTSENILQCTRFEQLISIQNTDVFLDEKIINYIDMVTNPNYNNTEPFLVLSEENFIEIYNSLNKKDREIIIRTPIQNVLKLGTIVRYDIRLTKQYLMHMILYGHWRSIIKLLCFTNKYDYLYNMFDIEMILQIPSMIARMWFLNNIYNSSTKLYVLSIPSNYQKLFVTPCNIFDTKLNLNIDMANLLKSNLINDVNVIQNNIIANKQSARKLYVSNNK